MVDTQGTPIWYELITGDADGAERFYGHVLAWRFSRPPGGMERDHRIAETGDTGVAGVMQCPAGMAMPTRWLVYFGVDDVDRTAKTSEAWRNGRDDRQHRIPSHRLSGPKTPASRSFGCLSIRYLFLFTRFEHP